MSNPYRDYIGPMTPTFEERLTSMQRQINDLKSALANNIDETQTIIAKQCRQADDIRTLQMGMPKNGFASSPAQEDVRLRKYDVEIDTAAKVRADLFKRSPFMDVVDETSKPVSPDEQTMIILLQRIDEYSRGQYGGSMILIPPKVIDEVRAFLIKRGWRTP